MRIINGYWKWLAAVVSTVAITGANAGSATFDFTDDPRDVFQDVTSTQEDVLWSEDGDWPGTGNPGGFLSITEAVGSTSTTAIFPDIDGGNLVKAFNLKMDIRTGNGSTDRPADGFSISYARAGDSVFDGFSLPGPPENGTATGIVVSFDTWKGNTLTDGSGDIEGIIVVVDGVAVNKTALPTRHGECDDITSLQTGPQGSDDGDFPRGDPGTLCWAPFEVDLTEDGLLTVTYKGNVVLDGFQSNFFPSPGQLVIAGRTGGANEILHVDNIELNTILAGDEVLLSGLSSDVDGFTVSFREEGSATLDPTSIELTLDGVSVTGDISKDGVVTTVVYSQKEFFAPNSEHIVGVKAAGGISKEVGFTTPDYAVIGADNALSGNFSDRGFLMRVLQADQGIDNATGAREEHLAGTLTDADGNPLENFIDDFGFDGDTIEIEGVINFDQDGNPQGVFRDSGDGSVTDVFDDFIPGIPGLDGSTDQITAEILTVVEIPSSGLYNFAFNSDDGFKTTAGAVGDAQTAIVIAEFSGGRGASTSFGTVLFEEPGFYKLRSLWYEGGGGANLEWWTADLEGNPIALLNDDAAGGLKTYRTIPEDPASIASISPADGTGEVPANTTVSVVIKNGSTSYDDGSASGTLNGDALTVDVNSGDGTVTLSADLADLPGNSEFTWEISFTAGGIARTAGGSFSTTVLAGEGLLFIETEDFNFELGKWDTTNDIGMSGGAYPGGTYQDLGDGLDETDVDAGTSYGVDYFESNNANSQAIYRPDTGVEAGKMNGSAGMFRGSFDVETNHTVGWNDGGDWYNYTRDFPEPAQNYNIYGHLSSGGDPIDVSLLRVTSEVTTSTQETEVIGHWRPGRATAGWDNLEIFPLTDDAGDAAVASLGGRTTLRYSVNGGHNDNDFIVFVPAGAAPEPPVVVPPVVPPVLPPIVLPPIPGGGGPGEVSGITNNADGTVTIEYTGTLQSSGTVDGSYSPVAGAASPYTVSTSDASAFYIAR